MIGLLPLDFVCPWKGNKPSLLLINDHNQLVSWLFCLRERSGEKGKEGYAFAVVYSTLDTRVSGQVSIIIPHRAIQLTTKGSVL